MCDQQCEQNLFWLAYQKVQGLTAAGSLFGKLLLRVSNTWRRGSLLMAHQSEKEFFLSSQGIWSGTVKNLVGLQPCQTHAALTAMQKIYLKVAQCHLQISETMRAGNAASKHSRTKPLLTIHFIRYQEFAGGPPNLTSCT